MNPLLSLRNSEIVMTEFDKATERIPKWILACPIAAHWLEYKGETYFGMLNYERSIKARRPMIDLCYCATEALNGLVIKTVQYSEKHFKESTINDHSRIP